MTLSLAAALMLPLTAGIGMVSLDARHEAAESLDRSLKNAVASYQRRQGLKVMESRGEEEAEEHRIKVEELAMEKRSARLQLSAALVDFEAVRAQYGITETKADALARMAREAKIALLADAKEGYLRRERDLRAMEVRGLFRLFLAAREPVIDGARLTTIEGLVKAAAIARTVEGLNARNEQLIAEHEAATKIYERSQGIVRLSEAEMQQIKAIVQDVHEQVLALQSQLSRIDAQLKERAERALLEKGLISPENIADHAAADTPDFSWPAYGSISAGFHNAAYEKHFGVPHEGVDIRAGQGSPVYAAADGIVFLVRDGGKTGYTYVLIGHKNGYASLYGHLSSVTVSAGQRVTVGQAIGLSGGKPGTYGAGPMTTGPHLHFEVIQGGSNVDPLTVLPS